MITAMTVTTPVAATGVPYRECAAPVPRSPKESRDIAYTIRAAATVLARQQPNADTVVPAVITLPTQEPTYDDPRSPSSEGDDPKAAMPLSDVPNPIISTAVTTTK